MALNDNRTPEIQRAIEAYEQRLEACGRELLPASLQSLRANVHPNIQGLPDYGASSLRSETEIYCRSLCEKIGMSYEDLKERFTASHQVIQPRQRNPITLHLIGKGVVPIDWLDKGFRAYVQGAVAMRRKLKAERAEKIAHKFSSVN